MFSKYLWRYSCMMKSTARCYLFNIWIFRSNMLYLHVSRVHSAHCVWKCTVIFSWILNMGPHSSIGGARQIQQWGPEGGGRGACLGASLGPRGRGLSEAPGGASNSLAPALVADSIWVALQVFEQFCPKAGDANPLVAEPETHFNAKWPFKVIQGHLFWYHWAT